jgi:hypothetical protein
MIYGIQNHKEMQFMVEYGCSLIIIEGLTAPGLRKRLKSEFLFMFSLISKWIQMIFDIQMYHEEIKVKLEYVCCPISIALGLRKLIGNDSFCSFSQ